MLFSFVVVVSTLALTPATEPTSPAPVLDGSAPDEGTEHAQATSSATDSPAATSSGAPVAPPSSPAAATPEPAPSPAPSPVPPPASPRAQPVAPPTPDAESSAQQPAAVSPRAVAPPSSPPSPGFFADGQPGSYLSWYGAEYVAVAAVGTMLATGAFHGVQPLPALIGPSISLDNADVSALLDPRLDDVIGKPILQEKVSPAALAVGLGLVIAADAGLDLALRKDLHRTHALLLGGAEAVLASAVLTEALKLGVGRLRPDFRERFVRAACGGVVAKPAELSCDGVLDDGFQVDREMLLDGMKSFSSGHASSAFAGATFVALHLGAEHVWGRHGAEWARPVAAVAVGGLLAGAGFVAASRVEDHRHHLEDVVVGAGIGAASGLATYLVHFDLGGRARRRGVVVAPMPIASGAGVALAGDL